MSNSHLEQALGNILMRQVSNYTYFKEIKMFQKSYKKTKCCIMISEISQRQKLCYPLYVEYKKISEWI